MHASPKAYFHGTVMPKWSLVSCTKGTFHTSLNPRRVVLFKSPNKILPRLQRHIWIVSLKRVFLFCFNAIMPCFTENISYTSLHPKRIFCFDRQMKSCLPERHTSLHLKRVSQSWFHDQTKYCTVWQKDIFDTWLYSKRSFCLLYRVYCRLLGYGTPIANYE
jgi:hypothetical protein